MEGFGNTFTTHKYAHNRVHNLPLFMLIADWLVKMGDCGKLKEVHTNVCSAHLCVHFGPAEEKRQHKADDDAE